jgi:putative endonuclease
MLHEKIFSTIIQNDMAKHLSTGREGESLALKWLRVEGFTIIHSNWRFSYYEIDVIAEQNGILHFIEVKTRRSSRYGLPEESVSKTKFNRLLRAGEQFQSLNKKWNRVQYDILSITIAPNGQPEYFFIKDIWLDY